MSTSQMTPISLNALPKFKSGRASDATPAVALPSLQAVKWNSDQLSQVRFVSIPMDDGELIFDQLVALKLASADFASRLGEAWRAGLFKKLDDLMDADEWVFTDEFPSVASFKTLLRMIVHNSVSRRPSLGATSDGKIIASWRAGDSRLVVECFPNDEVRWVASREIDGRPVRAAGTSAVDFLMTALHPYKPEIWFG